ncbi:MAG TPA: MMPL family transporter [Solirubrobacteraceae bacterium]|nr:MMPL family transporter [Solirubrobacteraceae bacterium]
MRAKRFERLSGAAARRPILTVGIVLALAVGGGLLALGLRPSAGIDTFVSASSPSYRATADDERHFGDQAVVILIHESLPNLVETKDLGTLTQLEACLAGQYAVPNTTLHAFTPAPAGSHAPYGGWGSPCGKLMKSRATQVVYGPGTFLNRAVAAVNTQIGSMMSSVNTATHAAETRAYQLAIGKGMNKKQALAEANAAGQLEYQQQLQTLEQMAVSSGINSTPSIDDPQFIPQIVFDQTRGVNQPKARFAYLFPNKNSALIQVRLRSSLSDQQQAQAISWIRQAIRMRMFRSQYGGRYTVTGVPVVINDLASQITGSIAGLLIAALLVMAATLLVVFRARVRLLPLAIALAATGITFGLLALLGAGLTLASIAVLPILIGLAVDYGIQFQARAQEARCDEDAVKRDGRAPLSAAQAASVGQAVGQAAPAIGTAALATGTGFLVLLLSPVPMVRGFGMLLVVGIAVAFGCALTAGSAALVLAERDGGVLGASLRGARDIARAPMRAVGVVVRPLLRGSAAILRAVGRTAGEIITASLAGAADMLAGVRRRLFKRRRAALLVGDPLPEDGGRDRRPRAGGEGFAGRVATAAVARPGRVLAIAAALAVIGWVADTQTAVQSDVTKLVPSSMPALRNLNMLEKVTGVSGEIDVTVRAHDVATPQVVAWMVKYENALLTHYGYLEETGCAKATLCPALSLPDLFSTGGQAPTAASLSQSQINGLLGAVPSYFKEAVITSDQHEATLAFGIRLMPLARQEQVLEYMRSRLHPPAGVTAALAGLPVLAADANASLSSTGHRFLTLIVGLLAVGLVLLIVLRRAERAFVPLIPIALATGWSSLILFVIGIPLNPMSATLGALVIAISTEFSVLLSERYRQERAAGHELSAALARTYRSTGAAVMASGVTAIAGFGVLVFSDITMLRDFGFVTLVDLTVSLAGVLLVLPAALALSERGDVLVRLRAVADAAGGIVARRRRRPRVA